MQLSDPPQGRRRNLGCGRESGSDACRAYLRPATNTINCSGEPVVAGAAQAVLDQLSHIQVSNHIRACQSAYGIVCPV